MDVNELLHKHQLAKLKAQHTPSREDRAANCELVGRYAERLTAWRMAQGSPGAGWPRDDGLLLLGCRLMVTPEAPRPTGQAPERGKAKEALSRSQLRPSFRKASAPSRRRITASGHTHKPTWMMP